MLKSRCLFLYNRRVTGYLHVFDCLYGQPHKTEYVMCSNLNFITCMYSYMWSNKQFSPTALYCAPKILFYHLYVALVILPISILPNCNSHLRSRLGIFVLYYWTGMCTYIYVMLWIMQEPHINILDKKVCYNSWQNSWTQTLARSCLILRNVRVRGLLLHACGPDGRVLAKLIF